MSRRFQDRVVLITGAASGIGRATALAFAAEGARVVIGDIDSEGAEGTVQAIRERDGEACWQRCDVRDSDAVAALVALTEQRYGGLDCAFNNAGIEEEHDRLADGEEGLFDRMMAINVKGVWLCMKHQLPALLRRGRGAIVNTASVAGLVAAPKHAIYAASKHAVVGMSKSAAIEYGRAGIRVNTVCPAVIRTPMYERAIARDATLEESIRRMHPIGRIGEAEEIAQAVLWLCSDAAGFVTGHQLAVDGGLTAL